MVEGKTWSDTDQKEFKKNAVIKKEESQAKYTCRCAPNCPVFYDLLSVECENMTCLMKTGKIRDKMRF